MSGSDSTQPADQFDLFSQALSMLDEVNKDVQQLPSNTDQPESKSPQPAAHEPPQQLKVETTNVLESAVQVIKNGNPSPAVSTITSGKFLINNTSVNTLPTLPPTQFTVYNKSTGGTIIVRNGSAPQLSSLTQKAGNGLPTVLPSRDVSRIWSNETINMRSLSPNLNAMSSAKPAEEDEAEEEDEELGVAETYADYMPSKVKIGIRHPDPVVETSSLSSVEPPDVWYDVRIPEDVIDSGELSALQLESITYACQRHEVIFESGERAGYLVGDGAGVGKGRTIAGIIYENFLCGRKRALWLSVSNDLKIDAERDLSDIGASKILVYSLNKMKYAKISSAENNSVKKGVVFATYSSLIGETSATCKYNSRMKMLLNWCTLDFDGVIILDECHKAKNLYPSGSSKPTKTGLTVLELQRKLPKARVVYASATGASEPKNMAYMTRLGLWGPGTPFKQFLDFNQAVERRGVGAMELVAMDMKMRGMYIARQLSFNGVSFQIEDIPVPKETVKVYNTAVKLWVDAKNKFTEAAELIDAERSMAKSMWAQFWSSHQRFFKYMCISSKVRHAVKIAKDALAADKCVVIGLQSTGEARTIEQLEEMGGELTDFVSTAKGVFQSLIEKHFPAPDSKRALNILKEKKSSLFDDLDLSNIMSSDRSQRKASMNMKGRRATRSGQGSVYKEEKISDESDTSSESEFEPSDDEQSSASSNESSDQSDNGDNFNPFGGSDSDDDPWIKKSKSSSSSKRKRKEKSPKKAKRRKKEEKNNPNSGRTSASSHKSSKAEDDDSLCEYDSMMDNVLSKTKSALNRANSQPQLSASSPNGLGPSGLTPEEAKKKALALKNELLEGLDRLSDSLPSNTLDELIDSFGGADNVAEMTGRKGRVVSDRHGNISYELRTAQDVPLEILNITEKQRFMDGEKRVAIISEAASSGISLQSDRRVANQRRRVHITLELPWSADRAVQQFGRTHRSNQVNAPEYVFLISELAGERRFASTVAKRLECLGALTHGDRRATESRDLSQFNIDNKYGRAALERVMKSIAGHERPLVPTPTSYKGDFMKDIAQSLSGVGLITFTGSGMMMLEKDYNLISKFLNRILGLPVEQQNALFQYFTDTLAACILHAKKDGKWDLGILDLGAGGENVKVNQRKAFTHEYGGSITKTELVNVSVERGLSWEDAMDIWRGHIGSNDGFYLSNTSRQGKKLAILAVAASSGRKKDKLYKIYRPNLGLSPKMESLVDLKKKYKKVLSDVAEDQWVDQHQNSANMCFHMYCRGFCNKNNITSRCEIGLRTRSYHILMGSVLSVWDKVERVLAMASSVNQQKMQIIRLRTDAGKKIVGTLIPNSSVNALTMALQEKEQSGASVPSVSAAASSSLSRASPIVL